MSRSLRMSCALLTYWLILSAGSAAPAAPPRVQDPRLQVTLFAADPDLVQPVAAAFDAQGRLLVIESHTHFRPAEYQGPAQDRVRRIEDTDGDGRADRFTSFYEGTQASMDLALHPDGTVYLATRREIFRLEDRDGDGRAETSQPVVVLETKGNYPHNGLSGLAFDAYGDLYFGLGENLGEPYRLLGRDDGELSGGGEGGSVYTCRRDGTRLRRVATGFWNPFGNGFDIFGRLFSVDNDPDAMPPCRLLHVVEGGDYGYQFRYGRSGRHVFQAWNGQLPGTLPMVEGTGEAPCEVLAYESDGLPEEFLGDLLVTSWADHRVERYRVQERGASVAASRLPFLQGDDDFRPVGLAVAPDGSLFITDWVLRDYNLHGRGAVWRVSRSSEGSAAARPEQAEAAFCSQDRITREAAARKLAQDGAGRGFLTTQLQDPEVRRRASALSALALRELPSAECRRVAREDASLPLRALAVRYLAQAGEDVSEFADPTQPPPVRREALAHLRSADSQQRVLENCGEEDPFLQQAAVYRLSATPAWLLPLSDNQLRDPRRRAAMLLAYRAAGTANSAAVLESALQDEDPGVRFLAAKWISDERRVEFRGAVQAALEKAPQDWQLYLALSTALARLDQQEVNENQLAAYFLDRIEKSDLPATLRMAALRAIPATYKGLGLNRLRAWLQQPDPAWQREVLRAINDHPDEQRFALLREVVQRTDLEPSLRALAIAGLAERAAEHLGLLWPLLQQGPTEVRAEVLRALLRTPLSADQRRELEGLCSQDSELAPLAQRLLGRPFHSARPAATDVDGWLQRLERPADPVAGERVFQHAGLARCSRCHRVDGRGQNVGPELSHVGRTARRHLLQAVLQPSQLVAPHYQVWSLETEAGQVRTGMLVHTQLDEYTYVDPQGELFKLRTGDIAQTRPLSTSLMPENLVDLLTDQEFADLLAYLASRQ